MTLIGHAKERTPISADGPSHVPPNLQARVVRRDLRLHPAIAATIAEHCDIRFGCSKGVEPPPSLARSLLRWIPRLHARPDAKAGAGSAYRNAGALPQHTKTYPSSESRYAEDGRGSDPRACLTTSLRKAGGEGLRTHAVPAYMFPSYRGAGQGHGAGALDRSFSRTGRLGRRAAW